MITTKLMPTKIACRSTRPDSTSLPAIAERTIATPKMDRTMTAPNSQKSKFFQL